MFWTGHHRHVIILIPDNNSQNTHTHTHTRTRTTTLTSDHHHGHGEDLLPVGGGRDVAKADAGEAGHGEVQRGDVHRVLVRPALPLARAAGVEAVGRAGRLGQDVEPAVQTHDVGVLVDHLVVPDAVPDGGGGGRRRREGEDVLGTV